MDAKLKSKWAAALRSGKYRQTDSYLEHEGGFCCLGVLCAIQGANINKLLPGDEDRMTSALPRGFNAGLSVKQRTHLAAMNDRGKNFYEIADCIEKNL